MYSACSPSAPPRRITCLYRQRLHHRAYAITAIAIAFSPPVATADGLAVDLLYAPPLPPPRLPAPIPTPRTRLPTRTCRRLGATTTTVTRWRWARNGTLAGRADWDAARRGAWTASLSRRGYPRDAATLRDGRDCWRTNTVSAAAPQQHAKHSYLCAQSAAARRCARWRLGRLWWRLATTPQEPMTGRLAGRAPRFAGRRCRVGDVRLRLLYQPTPVYDIQKTAC